MIAYVYRGALLCDACAEKCRAELMATPTPLGALVAQWGRFWEQARDLGDSEGWPQGPYFNGGGEADCPQHCDACRVFLENPLTTDGLDFVRDTIRLGEGRAEVLNQWREFYS